MTRQKVALVTGASSGIGYSTSIELAKRGYKVYAGARRLEPMAALKDHGIITFELDVSSLDSIKNARKVISAQENGFLDVLYNNAGQSCTIPALDAPDDWFKQCYEVNVFGPMRMVREFGPLLINAKGVIGFTGSISGFVPFPFSSVYSSSKAAIHQYAATLRLELKPFGVRVVNVVTGGVQTNIADTRELPSDSIYNVANMQEAFLERKQMAARNKPMSAEAYAYQVVNDFENLTINKEVHVYRGAKAYLLAWAMSLFPRFIVEHFLIKKFALVQVFRVLKEKFSKKKIE